MNDAARNDKLHRILNRHLEIDYLVPWAEKKETRGRIRRRRNEDIHHLDVDLFGHLAPCAAGHKADHPQSAAWILNKHSVAKRIRLGRDDRLENLLAGTIDGPHDGHPVENGFAKPDDPATKKTRGDRADGGDQNKANDQACPGDIGEDKPIEARQDARHLPVDQFNGRPGDVNGQKHRGCHQQSGQEPGPQAPQNPRAFHR